MPKATAKKTASAPKPLSDGPSAPPHPPGRKKLLLAIFIAGVTGIIVAGYLRSPSGSCHGYQTADLYRNDKTVRIEGISFNTEVVKTLDEQRRGLSGRPCIPDNQAMLFVYQEPKRICFWMKEMRFPIDMVWLDAEQKIMTIWESVEPSTYPQEFCPDGPARYVLEFQAGTARKHHFSKGQQATF